jgi:hypothetical protein
MELGAGCAAILMSFLEKVEEVLLFLRFGKGKGNAI